MVGFGTLSRTKVWTFGRDSWWWVLVLCRERRFGHLGGLVGGGFWYFVAIEGLDIWEE